MNTESPSSQDFTSPPSQMEASSRTRRGFLQSLLGVFLVITGATFIGPVLAYLSPRKKKGGKHVLLDKNFRPILLQELEGKPYVVGMGVEDENTIVMRYAGELRAFSAVCTHLGCTVMWNPGPGEFVCPCHGGKFDANGVNIAGPPPAPLKRFRAYATPEGQIGLEGQAG
jgi:cytochrome b6-f complex iron-sulfur subunit